MHFSNMNRGTTTPDRKHPHREAVVRVLVESSHVYRGLRKQLDTMPVKTLQGLGLNRHTCCVRVVYPQGDNIFKCFISLIGSCHPTVPPKNPNGESSQDVKYTLLSFYD